jgi:hypothetical protein
VSSTLFTSFAVAGFGVALLHVTFPTHWLPFVLVGRAQGWRLSRVLSAATLAAVGHIVTTAVFGAIIVAAGTFAERWIAGLPRLAAAALLLGFGVFYLSRALQRAPAVAPSGGGGAVGPAPPKGADGAAFWGLVAMLALSPGEFLLSFYISPAAAAQGWPGFAVMTAAFLAGTLAGMLALISLTWTGLAHFAVDRLARYDSVILGVLLILLGVAVLVIQP